MNVHITGRHLDVTDALKAHVGSGLEKLRGHFDKVIDANVVLSVEKKRHIAEITLLANGIRIHGKESSDDMYVAVDAVLAKLDKQIQRFKGRINRHQPRKAERERMYQHHVLAYEEGSGNGEMHERPHRIIEREELSMKPMSVEEATMQLELAGDEFLVFSNADTQQVNVIYARKDGAYGLIEPQF